MNLELFIAKKIHFGSTGEKRVSPPAVRIAMIGIALGLAVMILSVSIVIGFKKEVRNKVIGFGSTIQITNFDSNSSYEMQSIHTSDTLFRDIRSVKGVSNVQRFATKLGIIKLDSAFQGIVLKGISRENDWRFFKENLVAGELINTQLEMPSNDIMVSKNIADKLHLVLGQRILVYFVEDQLKVRKFTVKGIYQTNFTEYDKLFVLADLRHIQKLNGWSKSEVGGIEVMISDFNNLDDVTDNLVTKISNKRSKYGSDYYVRNVKELNPQIFNWLDLLDMNVWIILILMISVAGFTMISGLLIIILERTNMIGIMKAMGANNSSIRKIFLYVSFFLIGRGMLWGNVIGLSLAFLQQRFHLISLNPEVYYLSAVPIDFNWLFLILLNVGALLASMFMLLGPSYMISKIRPAESIRFE